MGKSLINGKELFKQHCTDLTINADEIFCIGEGNHASSDGRFVYDVGLFKIRDCRKNGIRYVIKYYSASQLYLAWDLKVHTTGFVFTVKEDNVANAINGKNIVSVPKGLGYDGKEDVIAFRIDGITEFIEKYVISKK